MATSLFTPEKGPAPARSPRGRRSMLIATLVVMLFGIVATLWLIGTREQEPTSAPRRAPAVRKSIEPVVAKASLGVTADARGARVVIDGRSVGTVPLTLDDLAPGRHRVRVEAVGRVPWEREISLLPGEGQKLAARLSLVPPRLSVESDIPGAIVFLDKRYLGKTPLTAREIPRGFHQVDVSVEGYEVHSETINLDKGERSIKVRFRQMHLDERIAVVHRHGFGSCEGQLVATLRGLRFESSHAKHSFSTALDAIERFEVDYLKKNLRVRLRGGRTYNFTIRDENPDPLLVFHGEVERVRSRMARKGASG